MRALTPSFIQSTQLHTHSQSTTAISTLSTVNNLGLLYADQGRLDKAETMYSRALQGKEEALGPKHTSTLTTVHSLGALYADQGRLDKAEAMYNQALQGYEEAIKPEHLPTYLPAFNTMWGLAALFYRQYRIEDARVWYSKALAGYEKVKGIDHSTCETLRNILAALERAQDEVGLLNEELPLQESGDEGSPANMNTGQDKSASKRHRLLRKIRWKR